MKNYTIDFQGLEKFLKSLQYTDIETYHNEPNQPKLSMGDSILDLEHFGQNTSLIPDEKIINLNEPFLVDALGNDLSVVVLTKKRYKLPTGRVVNFKYIKTIVEDCREIYHTPLNGYWKIPKQFIKYESKNQRG